MTKIFKYEALGNDYLVIDPNFCSVEMSKDNIVKIWINY